MKKRTVKRLSALLCAAVLLTAIPASAYSSIKAAETPISYIGDNDQAQGEEQPSAVNEDTSSTEPTATEPTATEPTVSEPVSETQPDSTEPTATEPSVPGESTSEQDTTPTETSATETTPTEPNPPEPVIEYSGKVGTNLDFSFDIDTGTLTISGKGKAMNDFSQSTPAPWHAYAESIKKLDLSKATKLTNIGSYSFIDLANLKTLEIPETVRVIGVSAFMNTGAIKKLVIPKKVNTIYTKAFTDSKVKNLIFKNKDTAINGGTLTVPSSTKLHVFKNSKAHKYAVKYEKKYTLMVDSITFSVPRAVVTKGTKYKMPVTISPNNAKTIVWTSSNTKIATVSKKGVVTAKKKGACDITAYTTDESKTTSVNFRFMVTNFKLNEYMFTKNACYVECTAIDPKGVVVHSTGVNYPYLSAYIPNWNTYHPGGREVCVHGFIGLDSKGSLQAYQVLPFEMACWGVGGGSKGSYNYYPGYIQFECCEDGLYNKNYYDKMMDKATDYCAYLCLRYAFSYKNVVSHAESCALGYGSNHGDPDHWMKKYGQTMNDFRKIVKKKIYEIDPKADLKSGMKNKAVTVKKDAEIWSKDIVDKYGNQSKIISEHSKGDTVYFVRDWFNGWSVVKNADGEEGYMRNDCIDLLYTSPFYTKKVVYNGSPVYNAPSAKKANKAKTIKGLTKVKLISSITKGKKKGWSLIICNKEEYYIKTANLA